MEQSMINFIHQLWEAGFKSPLALEKLLIQMVSKKKSYIIRDFSKAVGAIRRGQSLEFENQLGIIQYENEETSVEQLEKWLIAGNYEFPPDQKRYSTAEMTKIVNLAKTFLPKTLNNTEDDDTSLLVDLRQQATKLNNEESDTDFSDSEAIIDRFFNSIKDENLNTFQQTFVRRADGEQQILCTPAELVSEGFLVKIEVSDISEISNIRESERWKKVSKKSIFIIKNKQDRKYVQLKQLLNSVLRDIVKIRGVKREIKKRNI
jgi:hypothetical protein